MSAGTRPNFDFRLDDYRRMLREFAALGYRSVTLGQVGKGDRDLFLRHDIDMCIDRAVTVADVEASEGMIATYYVLVSTSIYNPAAAENRRQFQRLTALGHKIGLHFDATRYSGGRVELERAATEECEILAHIASAPVDSISFHRPAPELLGIEGDFAGRPHSYDPAIMQNVAYVSDSSGGFFQRHPLDHEAVREGRAIQVLTHPIWWHADEATTAAEALDRLRSEHHHRLDATLAAAVAKAASRAIAGRSVS